MTQSITRQNSRNKGHFSFEVRHKPWFGPLGKATAALEKVTIQPISEEEYLSYLHTNFPQIYAELTFVQFYQFEKLDKHKLSTGKEYRIAICYLRPNPIQRDSLYIFREQITCSTGWYPLMMGEKASVSFRQSKLPRHWENGDVLLNKMAIGRLSTLRNVAAGEEGSAFLLGGDEGCILLDTGMAIRDPLPTNLKAIFLSHFHYDHSGGVKDILGYRKPLFLSEPTLRYLHVSNYRNEDFQKTLLSNAVIIERLLPAFQSNQYFQVYPIFHAPGSYGFAVSDNDGRWLFYPGDICIKNGFLDVTTELRKIILTADANRKWVLIDATMVSREQVEISDEDTPEALIDEMITDLAKRNVIFCSQSVETLIYEYILAFVRTRTKGDDRAIKLFIPEPLFRLLQSLLGPMLYHNYEQIDPFIQSVIGKNVTNFVESHRVYPLRSLVEISPNEKVVIFATPYDIENQENLQSRIFGSNVILAGTLALRPDQLPDVISSGKPRTVLRVASPNWSFHSHEGDLVEFIRGLTNEGVSVLLFHNFQKRLKKFIIRHKLDQNLVRIIESNEVMLN